MEKLQFLCWWGMTMVNLPEGVWEMTLQAETQEKVQELLVQSSLQVAKLRNSSTKKAEII